MVEDMKKRGFAYEDQGALVVDVKEESDTKEIPPCMLLKSDGASLYTTTDLATIVERMKLFQPDEILYVVDKRQELHFIQVFRCARKTGLVNPETKLSFLGFGTMNGKDGKPFKTREGGVMRLENLIREIDDEMYKKIMDNRTVEEEDARRTAEEVGLAAIKYGDLSNTAFSCLKRLTIFSVHCTKSKECKFCLRFYNSCLLRTTEYLHKMQFLTLINNIDS